MTLLFTDVDRSTELLKTLGERYAGVLAQHRDLLRRSFAAHGGIEVDTQGDSFFVAFGGAGGAVRAAVAAQRALAENPWPDKAPVSVRIGLHTGEPYLAEDRYSGVAVHRAARICSIGHGGQVLLSRTTAGIVDDEQIRGVTLRDLGEHRLKDIDRPEQIFQLVIAGAPSNFPPLRTIDRQLAWTGTVTVVMAEGRRMMRLSRELSAERFAALLGDYQRLLRELFGELGGREIEVSLDTAMAAFPTPKRAALAAVAALRAVAAHDWPHGLRPAISVGLHSGQAAIGWVGPAALRCSELCDAADGGQIFMSPATASLLEDEDLGELLVRDLGERRTRRTQEALHAFELVAPSVAGTT